MRVKILVEFEVEIDPEYADSEDELDEATAKAAASCAAWSNLVMTANGQDVASQVHAHVDGFGSCIVKVGEDHA